MVDNMCLPEVCPPKIGSKAPDFSATTTYGQIKLSDYCGKWVVLFSHPGDFTPICTTEYIAFAQCYPYFCERNVQLIGLSVDSNPSHLAWVYNIYLNTGIQIPFPVIADRDASIARLYGMMAADSSNTETVRTVFVIDPNQIVRAIIIYPMTNGRNIPEIIRLIDGLQLSDKEKVVTPANWCPGMPVMVPPPKTYEQLLERTQCPRGLKCIDWYWCYKQI